MNRRDLLQNAGLGFGALAASALLGESTAAATTLAGTGLGPSEKFGKAKRVIYLFMHGGVSHVDTFDPKPALEKWAGKPLTGEAVKGLKTSRIDFNKAIARPSPFGFKRWGQSGMEISNLMPNIAAHADRLALVRSCYGEAFDHAPAMYLRCSGVQIPGRPCLGSWLSYGLGSENKNLPGFVVMSDGAMKSGPQAYGAGYLPSRYQGTILRAGKNPILNLATPPHVAPKAQQNTVELVRDLDRLHLATRPGDSDLEARLESYELAYRMQSHAPEAVDLASESAATRKLYGIDEPLTDNFGRKCLLARRLVERGVRFVQLFSGTHLGDDWDNAHDDLVGSHTRMAGKTDKPIAALLTDLQALGLLDETLVVWASEFGRTPLAEGKNGRDHHPYGFSMWMAGGGIKGGQVLGATDEFGLRAVEDPFSIHDVHATLLRLIGVDHLKLTYLYQSREQRLTDVHGEHEFTKRLLG
ncbi:MAG: DUF1501 domain-containing protein [Deltaproteobacteria bacterium]|nr:DUF1501 domain-containing protein [Deltaproteobacteria bacterium]